MRTSDERYFLEDISKVIPDAKTMGRFAEIKDVKTLALTQQLRGEVAAAKALEQPLDLIVIPRAQRLTQPLIDAIKSTQGTITRFDPATNTRAPYTQ